jgi:CelD/BcsL family acetyltransferase involved in cellulose biosynthesis
MHVTCHLTLDELEPLRPEWDALAAGNPFRGPDWLLTWWRHYGSLAGRELFVVAVRDAGGDLIALAPCYRAHALANGRVVRFLGDGEVCTDHVTVLCRPGSELEAAPALADALCQGPSSPRWDALDLAAVATDDPLLAPLADAMSQRGCPVDHQAGPNCWRVELPASWDDYLAGLSKSHRKKIRRLEKHTVDPGRAVLRAVEDAASLEQGFAFLVDLHQRRWRRLGQPGCFASQRFTNFHRDMTAQLLRAGRLRLQWLELDGRPVAAEYNLAGDQAIYAYQSGVDPDALDEQPGRIIAAAAIRQAIEQGLAAFDFLRGDEPYKASWRATARPTVNYRIAAPRALSRLRHAGWLAARALKRQARAWLRPMAATTDEHHDSAECESPSAEKRPESQPQQQPQPTANQSARAPVLAGQDE